jgi:uncharacterized protein YbbC (DUF1343 family)
MLIKNIQQVSSGLDVLEKEGFLRLQKKRVAILANQASINKNFEHIIDLAIKYGIKIIKLFAPEHGLSGALQYMETVNKIIDKRLNIEVISLYGDNEDSLKLKACELKDVDILLCDLWDIGTRYYTFHCTIAWAMSACAQSRTKLMVLDRPNPINADTIEGNLIKRPNFSFVGAYPLMNRHGLSMGELLTHVKSLLNIDVDLEVVWMQNYNRTLYLDETDIAFVPPSPNMPNINAALTYPGTCLFEATNLSEGRGTCFPFEQIGAAYITDPYDFKTRIDNLGFEGVYLRPIYFKPMFNKFANQTCGGIFIHITNRKLFKPLRFGLGILSVAMQYKDFAWRSEPYEFVSDRLAIDLLLGDEQLRLMLQEKACMRDFDNYFSKQESIHNTTRKNYLRY